MQGNCVLYDEKALGSLFRPNLVRQLIYLVTLSNGSNHSDFKKKYWQHFIILPYTFLGAGPCLHLRASLMCW